MASRANAWDDEKVERLMGNLLRAGVVLAALVVAAGSLLYLARHATASAAYGVFHGEPANLRSLPGIVRGAFSLTGRGIIQLGILLLIATPVARVAFSVYAFARERDRMYVVITLIVLTVLLYSLFGQH